MGAPKSTAAATTTLGAELPHEAEHRSADAARGLGDMGDLCDMLEEHRSAVQQAASKLGIDSDDLWQETFVTCVEHRVQRADIRDEPAWVKTVARNTGLGMLRKVRSEREKTVPGVDPLELSDGALSAGDGATCALEVRELASLLEAATRRLSSLSLRALDLRVVDGAPYDAIARRLGVSSAAARNRVHRALRDLRAGALARVFED